MRISTVPFATPSRVSLDLFCRAEAGEDADVDGKVAESVGESFR